MEQLKFCKDCRHCSVTPVGPESLQDPWLSARCARVPVKIDLVTGGAKDDDDARCSYQRIIGCGQSARYFEPKE